MKYIDCIGFTTVCIMAIVFCVFSVMAVKDMRSIQGDMNNDGILNITDLSILASVVNEQG